MAHIDDLILRSLIDNVSEAIIVTDVSFVIRGWNQAASRIYGWRAAEVIGQATPDVLGTSFDVQGMEHAFEVLRRTGEWQGEVWQRRKDGEKRLISSSVSLLRSGGQSLIVAVNRDITDRWRTKARIERRDAILEAISYMAEQLLTAPINEGTLNDVMARLGGATDASRVYLFRRDPEVLDRPVVGQIAEWVAPGIDSQIDNPDLQHVDLSQSGLRRWGEMLIGGELIVGHVGDFPPGEQELLRPQKIYSLCVVPIFAEGRWWGFVGFDECRAEREWSTSEQEALQTAARILGGALRNREAEEALRALAQRLQQVVETERQRIARDLHDGVGQSVNALGINLNLVRQYLQTDWEQANRWLDRSSEMVDRTLRMLRDVIEELRPSMLDEYGLCAALETYVEEYSERSSVAATVSCDAGSDRLPSVWEISLFRIAQEALNNVAKHADAAHVALTLEELPAGGVRLSISDDGRGFDANAVGSQRRGWGMVTMRERALAIGGTLNIESAPGEGTRVEVVVRSD